MKAPNALIASVRQRIPGWKQNKLIRNAGWMLVGQGLSIVAQAGYFVVLARLLGAEEYGVFAGAFAFVAIASPYASMASGTLFMRHAGSNPAKVPLFLGHILLSVSLLGSVFVLLLWLLAPHLLSPSSASLVLLIGIGQCIFTQAVNNASQVFQAFENLKTTALLSFFVNACRFVAVLVMMLTLHRASAYQWAIASTSVAGLSTLACLTLVLRRTGRPTFNVRSFVYHMPEGMGFALGHSAQTVYNDVDKTLLSHYGMNFANGIYTTAYRAVDIATLPITALDAAALPRYFRESEDQEGVMALSERLGVRAGSIGLVLAVIMFAAAPLMPVLLGPNFVQSTAALRWLCLIPALRGWHQLTGSAIAGLGFQRYRTVTQFFAAGLNLGLNLWLIPRFGWLGAAWASLASDGSLCLLNLISFQLIRHRHPPTVHRVS